MVPPTFQLVSPTGVYLILPKTSSHEQYSTEIVVDAAFLDLHGFVPLLYPPAVLFHTDHEKRQLQLCACQQRIQHHLRKIHRQILNGLS